jgi:glycogen debranching enzyme
MDLQTEGLAEWLEPDGLGGFASGTAGLIRTRRYHALLLAAATPPTGRFVLVNGMEVWVQTPGGRFALSSQAYAGDAVFPDGQWHIDSFTAAPWPRWRFVLPDGTVVCHEIFTARDTADVVQRWSSDRPVQLTARPLLSGRDYHALHHENPGFDFTTRHVGDALVWQPYPGIPAITARGNFTWADGPDWYRRFTYAVDRDRGLDDGEDLASPGTFSWTVAPDAPAMLVLRAGHPGTAPAAGLEAAEHTRRQRPVRDVAADAYLAKRGDGHTLLAGFPWFTDWGRDTFISLRGLLITRGRLREAAEILLAWAEHVSQGMLPNRFPDYGDTAEYNAVDASLWFVVAVHELIEAGGASRPVAARLQAAAIAILEGYSAGTRFGIGVDERDGLLRAGVPGVQLTWMDAKIGEDVITPRIGKPVEIQALWVNALAIAGRWPGGDQWMTAAVRARDSVVALFPDPETGGLIDILDVDGVPGARDRKVRPNQVLAAGGLPIPVLTPRLIAWVVALAERSLLTPLGLRTLAPEDPEYQPHYRGSPLDRDRAYHQGTVWPWLLGPFVAAWLTDQGKTPADLARAQAVGRERFLPPLYMHMRSYGIGHVSEVADGDAPHHPGGCPFQAWSLGELIRIEALLGAPTAGADDGH